MKRNIRTLSVVSFMLMLALSLETSAQQVSSFEQLQLLVKPGDNIYVTDFVGKTTKGRIASVSDSSLELTVDGVRRDWIQKDVREIRQWRGDSLRNGALIGAGAGVGWAALGIALECNCEVAQATAGILFLGGLGAAIGAGIDALIPSKQTIFLNKNQGSTRRFEIRPILNRSHKGAKVAFSF